MAKKFKVGDYVEIKKNSEWYGGEWGKVVDANVEDDEYSVSLWNGDSAPLFSSKELKPYNPPFATESLITEKLEVHKELNPKLWDTNMNLLPDVREKILEIVEEFRQTIEGMTEIEINPIDIYLLGSNASYNYTSHSDIDVHIVVNFLTIDDNIGLVQTLMNFSKADFNESYDISIHGIDVELYVEDVTASTMSNGIYSVMTEQWIKKPEPIEVPELDIEADIDEWKDKVNEALDSKDPDKINKMVDDLYLLRKNGLLSEGEYGKGNQIFKEIRNLELLDDLKSEYMKLKSKELSLENNRKKGNRTMRRKLESASDRVDYRFLDDIEEGMINNMDDKDIDYWVRADDNICKLLKSKRSEVVVCDTYQLEELINDNFTNWETVKTIAKYNLVLGSDANGNLVVTDDNGSAYFANVKSLDKMIEDNAPLYELEALNLKTTDEVSVIKRGDWELIKDSTFGDTDEYLILKNDEAVMSIRANSDDEATKRFWKYIQRGY